MLPSARHTRRRLRRAASMVGTALILGGLMPAAIAAPALAVSTDIYISEYVEGTSNNKALEFFNETGSAIDLAAGGYSVQMFFNGNPAAGLTINLTGTVANGDAYVLAHASASLPVLDRADQTSSAGWFNGDDAITLRKGTTVIDSIGQAGVDPGVEWGSGLTSTADNTLRRKAAIEAGDTNHLDAFDPSLEWEGFAVDTFSDLGGHPYVPPDSAPSVASVVPVDQASNVDETSNIEITFSEPVTVAGTWFSIMCGTTTHAAIASGGPTVYTLDPSVNFAPGASCTLTVFAAQVTDNDTNDPPDTMAANFTSSFSTGDVCATSYTRIYSIQGSGSSAAITGPVTTAGVVVGDFEGPSSGGLQGFYIQDATGDGDATTSDGIFVFTGITNNSVSVGDFVRVTGTARERSGMTAITGPASASDPVPSSGIVSCGTAAAPPAVDVTMPLASNTFLERLEGMKVRFPESLVIAEYFNFDQFGEIVLAEPLEGEDRPYTGTSIDEPGAAANARTAANLLRRITLDDGRSVSNPSPLRHPNGLEFTKTNLFRGGDTVSNAAGILSFDFSLYRIQPTGPADYSSENPRPATPDAVGGSLRAAAMNTLNFFLTPDYPNSPANPLDNKCGGNQNLECRGHDFDQPLEFERQRDKLLAALAGLDADVIGLNEIENTPGVDPLGDPTNGIVVGLNDLGAGPYDSIDTGVLGTDAIRVGLIYRTDKVAPVGPHEVLTSAVDPRFNEGRSRPVVAQTFEDLATGARFTVAVNHLKSKGSGCGAGDDDTTNGQGNCNLTRTLAAQALVDWLQSDPTGSGDRDYLILGDLNSYAQEDPIDEIKKGSDGIAGTADDYTNLIAEYQGTYAHSYVFDGQAGYLDHALASQTLAGQVTGATDWHINSDEPDVVDYDTSFKPTSQEATYEDNPYRSSDHDPVIVGLELLNFDFEGFQAPVDNPPVLNSVKAGASVPVKFELSGDLGLDVLFGTTAAPLTCDAGSSSDPIESTVSSGSSSLQYDLETNTYTYVWKTQKSYADSCRTFELTLDDGTFRQAAFSFTK